MNPETEQAARELAAMVTTGHDIPSDAITQAASRLTALLDAPDPEPTADQLAREQLAAQLEADAAQMRAQAEVSKLVGPDAGPDDLDAAAQRLRAGRDGCGGDRREERKT